MHAQKPRTSGTSIRIRTGTEGPYYDPYHYTELTVTRNGHEYWLRSGLGIEFRVDDKPMMEGNNEPNIIAEFTRLSGADPGQWEHWYGMLRNRCSKCGNRKKFEYHGGYVGETITCCGVCGEMICDDFHMGMIE